MRFLVILLAAAAALPAQPRKVIIDEDGSGPGGTNQMAMLALLQSPQVEVLGITIVTGDAWRDEEVQHTLRMLELTRHARVPVVPGAVFPLMRTQAGTKAVGQVPGQGSWFGAWGEDGTKPPHGPYEIPALKAGPPRTRPLHKDAAHFLVRQVRAHPGEITIYAGGPLTNIALALALDPHFAESTRGIIAMGGAIAPDTKDPEFTTHPNREFNFWFDPEATAKVLRANWPRFDLTTVDVSIKVPFTKQILDQIGQSRSPAAQYIAKYSPPESYMWDELTACAWLDPAIVAQSGVSYIDVELGRGADYGEARVYAELPPSKADLRSVHVQRDVDVAKFTKTFVDLMRR